MVFGRALYWFRRSSSLIQLKRMSLCLRKLISVSTQLSLEGCRIIHDSLKHNSYTSYMKGEDNPVTSADYKIQSMFIKGFQMHFPDLKIIGEETQEYSGLIQYDYDQLNLDIIPPESTIRQSLDISKACIWIDPIDCTLGFINGYVEDVTVLVGLTYDKKPIAGIIGTPFKLVGTQKVYDPVVSIGSVLEKEAFDLSGKGWTRKLRKFPINKPLKIATSNTRSSNSEANLLRTLRSQNVKAGGSGRKIMMVANGEVDAMCYCESWTHKWDSCAGDALIKAMGGRFTTPYGNNIRYDEHNKETHNKQGMVAALDKEVYEKCIDALAVF